MLAAIRTTFKQIVSVPINFLLIFGMPLIFCAIIPQCWYLLNLTEPATILPTLSQLCPIILGLLIFPTLIFQLRKGGLFNRMKLGGKHSPFIYVLWVMVIFFVLMIFSYFVCFAYSSAILGFGEPVRVIWQYARYDEVFFSLFSTTILTLAIGLLIGLLGKKGNTIMFFGAGVLAIAMIFSFCFTPLPFVYEITKEGSSSWITDFMYIWPLRFGSNLLYESWMCYPFYNPTSSSIFDIYHNLITSCFNSQVHVFWIYYFPVTTSTIKVFDLIMPFIYTGGIALFIVLTRKKIHWLTI